MNFNKYIKVVFVFLAGTIFSGFSNVVSAQSIGINMKVYSLKGTSGMDDYENYDRTPGYLKPDMHFHISPSKIKLRGVATPVPGLPIFNLPWGGGTFNPNYERHFFYENRWPSSTIFANSDPLGDEDNEDGNVIVNRTLAPQKLINLSWSHDIVVNVGFWANEEDRGWNTAMAGDDDYRFTVPDRYVPLSFLATAGNSNKVFTLSNNGGTHTHNGANKYPYYVTMLTYYNLDAIKPVLEILTPALQPGYEFCRGHELVLRANYEPNYTGGTFRWEYDLNGDNNWEYLAQTNSNVLTTFARKSATRYRVRLVPSKYSYGVNDFAATGSIAYSTPGSYIVQQIFDSYTFDEIDACPGFSGSVKLTSIVGAVEGLDYIVNIIEEDEDTGIHEVILQTDTIYNYSVANLAAQNVVFSKEPGNYYIQVLNNIPESKCAILTPFTIKESTYPEFEASKRDPFCFGENGVITFANINFKNNTDPYEHTITALASTGEMYSKTIYDLTDTLSVPAGTYTLAVENVDGCISQNSYTVTLNPKEEMLANIVAPSTTYQRDGVDYHGLCWDDKYGIEVNISGGVKPYRIVLERAGSAAKTYQLLESDSTFVLPDVSHGDYTVKVFDVYDCEVTPMLFDIVNPTKFQLTNLVVTNPTVGCGAIDINGVIKVNATGGFLPYTYFLNGTEVDSIQYTNLENGTYTIRIVDDNGCEVAKTITLANTGFTTMSDNGLIPYYVVPCSGSIKFRIYVEGGYLSWYENRFLFTMNGIDCNSNPNCSEVPGSFMQAYTGGDPNTYSIAYEVIVDNTNEQIFTMTDDIGCMLTSSYKFSDPFIPEVGSVTNVPPACVGDDYEVTFYLKDVNESVHGDFEPIDYVLDGVPGFVHYNTEDGTEDTPPLIPYQFTIPITDPGNHDIIVTDYMTCSTGLPFEFNLMPMDTFMLDVLEVNRVTCQGDSTGSIVAGLQGNPPFILSYSNYPVDYSDPDFPGVVFPRDTLIVADMEATIPDLIAGDYYISASNKNGCAITDLFVTVQPPSTLTATAASSSAINCTGNNGVIEVTNISGGTPPYRMALNDRAFQTATTLKAAQLENTIVVKDAIGCKATLSLSIPAAAQTLFSTLTPYQGATSCALGSAIIEIPAGFTEPLIVQKIEHPDSSNAIQIQNLGNVIATQNFRDTIYELALGRHYFVFQDGLGCELIDSVDVIIGDTLSAAVTLNKFETCYQQSSDGAFDITVTGGVAPYSITYDGENYDTVTSMASFTDLSYGRYHFQIVDAVGCFFNVSDSIIAGSIPWGLDTITNFIGCADDSLMAEVSMMGANGRAPFTFTWDDGTITDQKTLLAPSEYNVTVTDADGCWTRDNVLVLGPDSLRVNVNTITDAVCHADSNGAILLTANGGFGPYSFSIDDGATFQADSTFSDLAIGDYEIFVQDDHGCFDTIPATVNFTNALSATIVMENVSCNGENNASIQANLLGGIAPFTYSLDDVNYQPSNEFVGLMPGTYDVYIQDGSGCKAAYFGNVITEPTALSLSTSLTNHEACWQMNGAASGTASGGTAPLTFVWDGNPALNSLTLTNASAGEHTLMVTDANGCIASSSVTINNLPAPTLSLLSSADEICGNANGTISVQVTDGVGPMIYQWSHDADLVGPVAMSLTAGTYTVTVIDANGCTDFFTTTIGEIAGPSLSLTSKANSLCTDDNGTIEFQVASGTAPMTYSWSHDAGLNAPVATGLSAGNYSIEVTDANGCQDDLTVSIDFDAPPVIGAATTSQETCGFANGGISIPVSGGASPYQYTWSHDPMLNANTAADLVGGSYSVTVTDALGCTDELININVDAAAPPILTVSSFVNADCLSPLGSVTVQTTDGLAPFTYAWSHDGSATDVTVSGLMSGTYTATVTDANNCTSEVSQSLISFVGNSEITNDLVCFGDADGAIALTLEGNLSDYIYAWSDAGIPAGPTASNLAAGTYTVSVTNVNGCMESFTEEILDPAQVMPNISNVIPVGCLGNLGSAMAIPTGGTGAYNYTWNDANAQTNATAENLGIGTYEVTVTDALGCLNTESVLIEDSEPILTTEGVVTMPLCAGDDNGDIATLATGGFGILEYSWNTGQDTEVITDLTAGTYTLTVTDIVACTSEITVVLDEPDALISVASVVDPILCNGDETGSATVVVTGGTEPFQYAWNDPLNQTMETATALSSGSISVEITDANGCLDNAQVNIDQPDALSIAAIDLIQPNCVGEENGAIVVTVEGGTANYQYNWNAGLLQDASMINNLGAATYELEVVDANGCSISESIALDDRDPILFTSAIVTPGLCSEVPSGSIEVIAEGGTGDLTYSWSNGEQESLIENLASGEYTVTITDELGCEKLETYEVTSLEVEFISLGQADTLLCNGSVLYYDFSAMPFEIFSWSSASQGALSNEPIYTINSPDVYYFSVTNDQGCVVTDTIDVVYAAQNLDAFFIAPTDIVVGDTLVAVELTLPVPDEVNWTYDNNVVEFVGQDENQYLFTFTEVGTFDLGLAARLGNCYSEIGKEIFVYADSSSIPFINPLVPTILNVNVFPNPSSGVFTMEVELSSEQDMVIDIFNESSLLFDRALFSGAKDYSKDYNLVLSPGVYYAIIQVAGERRSITMVIN